MVHKVLFHPPPHNGGYYHYHDYNDHYYSITISVALEMSLSPPEPWLLT